ncbi:MAG TPA: universal stress protein, partial [Solirubrobacteraceae bacterium]
HLPDHEHDREITQAMRAVLERAASRLLPQGFDVSIRLPVGGPGPAIVEACDDEVDLLVAGSHAHGAMHSALAGSVARHLVDHAPCAVLVVPRHTAIELVAAEAPGGVRSASS